MINVRQRTDTKKSMAYATEHSNVAGCFHLEANSGLALVQEDTLMNMTLSIGPLVSLIAGILILIMPRLLNFIVAIYLIIIGLLGLFGSGNLHL